MSRIHEALRKAGLENAALESVATVTSTQGIAEKNEPELVPARIPTVTPAAKTVGLSIDANLRSDDLLSSCSRPVWVPGPNVNAFDPDCDPLCAEQFRILRSRLNRLRVDQGLRIILITSAVSNEGKTFVASNLAQAMVRQAEQRVLLIDADLRRSNLHTPLGAPSKPGLGSYLQGVADERSVIQHGDESNLYFIPGGDCVTNPSELLSNGLLKNFLNRMTTIFNWIIIDSPPCLPVADAGILAEFCDGLLFVVRANATPAKIVRNGCQKLDKRNILGVVLNASEEENVHYGSYYGYTQQRAEDGGAGTSTKSE